MTPHPDFAPMDMSIQAALRKMHGKRVPDQATHHVLLTWE
jgi:hypothetical protein